MFVPQSQKVKKVMGVVPHPGKHTKENVGPNVEPESVIQNKSEIPEESVQQEALAEEEHVEAQEEAVEASVDVA